MQIITLLLHQQRLPEAIAQFKTHVGLFCQLPFESPPAFAAAHWGWVARQYTVMGELMAARNEASALQVPSLTFPSSWKIMSCLSAKIRPANRDLATYSSRTTLSWYWLQGALRLEIRFDTNLWKILLKMHSWLLIWSWDWRYLAKDCNWRTVQTFWRLNLGVSC